MPKSSSTAIQGTIIMIVVLLAGVDIVSQGMIRQIFDPSLACDTATEKWDKGTKGCVPLSPFAISNGGGVAYYGPVDPRITNLDAIDSGKRYVMESFTYTWLRNTGAQGVPSSGYNVLQAGNNTFSTLQTDNGAVFLEAKSLASADLYLAIRSTLNGNPNVLEAYSYQDYDNDAVKEHIFRVNYQNLGIQAGQSTLDLPVSVTWFKKASTLTATVQEPSATAHGIHPLGGSNNVGTSANNTQVYRYRFTFDDFDKAVLLREMHIKFNSSSTNMWTIDKVELPTYNSQTGQYVIYTFDQTNVDETVLSSDSNYKWFFANDLSGIKDDGAIISSRSGGLLYTDIIIHVTWKMETNESLTMTVDLRWWDDTEIEQSSSAVIGIHEATKMS